MFAEKGKIGQSRTGEFIGRGLEDWRIVPSAKLEFIVGMDVHGVTEVDFRNTIIYLVMVLFHSDLLPIHTAKPPLLICLGSPAASNVPFFNNLSPCAELPAVADHVTFAPKPCKNEVVELSKAYSKDTCGGTS